MLLFLVYFELPLTKIPLEPWDVHDAFFTFFLPIVRFFSFPHGLGTEIWTIGVVVIGEVMVFKDSISQLKRGKPI